MTRFVLFILIIVSTTQVFAQGANSRNADSCENCLSSWITKETGVTYDLMLTYIEESYWWSDHPVYKVLARKDNDWTAIQLEKQRKKKGNFRPVLTIFKFPRDSAARLIERLERMNFWSLDSNDLRPKIEVQDGINYRFELITKGHSRKVEFYDPGSENSINLNHATKNFLIARELFLQMWDYKFKL